MFWDKYKYLIVGLAFVFLLSGVFAFFMTSRSAPQGKPQLQIDKPMVNSGFNVTEDTQIEYSMDYNLCVKFSLNCEPFPVTMNELERQKLTGLTLEEIREIYPPGDWNVFVQDGNSLAIIKNSPGLCPYHQQVKHLGVNYSQDYVAIYFGPQIVGTEGGIYRVTEIPFQNLPDDYQAKVLNHEIEFYQEEELIGILDSLSEYLKTSFENK